MYHDQALVPLKALDFDQGVNVTLGLPIVRTSPDHGTAFDIAGKGMASPGAMIAAIRMAGEWRRGGRRRDPAAAARGHRRARPQRVEGARARTSCSTSSCSTASPRFPATSPDRAVLEIGPGPGGLTRALLRAGARVTAIEMDRRCLPALAELGEAFPGQLRVIEGDAMKIDHDALMGEPYAVVANLPYNVGTALFVGWLGGEAWPPRWT